jgi:hypothetical protein
MYLIVQIFTVLQKKHSRYFALGLRFSEDHWTKKQLFSHKKKIVEQYQNCYILQVSDDGISHFEQHSASDITTITTIQS